MSDTLANPELAVGIPIHDCQCSRVSSAGVPTPPWAVGSQVSGRVSALYHAPTGGRYSSGRGAAAEGTGRSIIVDFQNSMDGGANSYLETPKSHWGWVPRLGTASSIGIRVFLVLSCSLNAGQSVVVKLLRYSSAGAFTETTVYTFDNTNTPGDTWTTYSLGPALVSTATDTRYFSLRFYFNANGAAASKWFALDAFGLGWLFFATSPGRYQLTEPYAPDGYEHPIMAASSIEAGGTVGTLDQLMVTNGGINRAMLRIPFRDLSLSAAQDLRALWNASRGFPSGGSDKGYSVGDMFQGRLWPLLVAPRRPGVRQLLYAYPMGTKFPLEVTGRYGFVPDESNFDGTLDLIEQVY